MRGLVHDAGGGMERSPLQLHDGVRGSVEWMDGGDSA